MSLMKPVLVGLAFAALVPSATATAADIVRHRIPGSDFPIAAAVEVPAGKTTVYVSGNVPRATDPAAPVNSKAAYGDTKTQTTSVLGTIEGQLKAMGLGMGDVVKMQVFLVGDADKEGKMDFAGFMEGYRQFFRTAEQPNLPARSTFQIAGLTNPGYLVEIEVIAVRP